MNSYLLTTCCKLEQLTHVLIGRSVGSHGSVIRQPLAAADRQAGPSAKVAEPPAPSPSPLVLLLALLSRGLRSAARDRPPAWLVLACGVGLCVHATTYLLITHLLCKRRVCACAVCVHTNTISSITYTCLTYVQVRTGF